MPSVDSGLFVLALTLAAGKPGTPENTEMIARYADEMLAVGNTAEAVDWYSRIVEGGESELGPQAALQIGVALVDDDNEASQAALRYAAEHGTGQVADVAARNLQVIADHGIVARTAPATLEEVVGLAALGRGRIWAAANDLQGAIEAFDFAAGSPVSDVAAEGLTLLGSALMMGGDQDAAVEVLNRAMASGHRRFGAMAAVDLAMILVDRDERDRASILLRPARDGDLAGTMAAVNLGVMLARFLGDLDGGITALRTAAQDQVPLIAAGGLFNLATLLEENGDRTGAEQAYRDAAELRQPMFSGKAALNLALLVSRRMDTVGERAAYQLAAEVGNPNEQAQARKMLVLLGGLV